VADVKDGHEGWLNDKDDAVIPHNEVANVFAKGRGFRCFVTALREVCE
jgi:hypothetical protein